MKSLSQNARIALTLGAAVSLFSVIVTAFWLEEWRYSLPTPRPASLQQVPVGQLVRLNAAPSLVPELVPSLVPELQPSREAAREEDKPIFLHFFNPGCPCSRFNLDHVRDLVRAQGHRVRFVAVLQGDEPQALQAGFARTGLGIESIVDAQGRIAKRLGVYSTPQAVILGRDGRLVYRGNYNSTRFCSARATEFARIALETYLSTGRAAPAPRAATIAYGCALPSNATLN